MSLSRTLRVLSISSLALAASCAQTGGEFGSFGGPTPPEFSVFAEAPAEGAGASIDYGAYAQLLGTIVYDVGRSDRTPASRPQLQTGSRIQRQNTSRYRLEANRIVFSIQPKALEEVTAEIVASFKAVAESETYDKLGDRGRLAFWLNFHNALLINQMAAQYPFQRVNNLNAVGTRTSVFSTDLVTVRGVPLSLNDIKYNIIFENWSDPIVLYGLYTGAVGGPNIRKAPYTAGSVREDLRSNAREFVNSLRGVEIEGGPNRISRIYANADMLFPRGADDIISHMLEFANTDTRSSLNRGGAVRADVFDWTIADISYGEMPPPISQTWSLGPEGLVGDFRALGLTPQAEQFIAEVENRKFQIFKRNGGSVTINDIPIAGPETEPDDEDDASE